MRLREQLAAVLLNHVYVVEHSLAIGSRHRKPTSSKYNEINSLDFDDTNAAAKLIKSFATFNAKHFIENNRFCLDKEISEINGLHIEWAPKVLVRGLSGKIIILGMPYIKAATFLNAMRYARQSDDCIATISNIGDLAGASSTIAASNESVAAISILIPGMRTSAYLNLAMEQRDLDILFRKKINFAKILNLCNSLSADEYQQILDGQSNLYVEFVNGSPLAVRLDETDAARAQRLAREALEALRIARTMVINDVTDTSNAITYNVSPINNIENTQDFSVDTDFLFGW
jgi:hypothetical protein